ncbi:hypothetical protein GDO81_024410, partial [Engystomops pustulosus]
SDQSYILLSLKEVNLVVGTIKGAIFSLLLLFVSYVEASRYKKHGDLALILSLPQHSTSLLTQYHLFYIQSQVWASASGVPHKPPTDYLWKEQNKFVTEPKCTTILCNPNGQAVAWFTPLRDKTRKSLEKYEIFNSDPKITSADLMKEPNLEVTSDGRIRAPRSPPACGRLEKVPRLLRREKISPSVLPVTSSPWTQSTASPTHPDFNPGHLVSLGSDESSLCRQTRSLTAKTAPSSGK